MPPVYQILIISGSHILEVLHALFFFCRGTDVEVDHSLCRMPITVYMIQEKTKDGLISIAEYGQEYRKSDPIQVLYHGFGHYEALQIPSNRAASKL